MTTPEPRDDGFSLIELMVYGLLMVVVLAIVGGLLINTLTVTRDVRSTTQAASVGQLVATTVDTAVRQASWVDVKNLTKAQYVAARTSTNGTTIGWQCQAWYLDLNGDGALYTKTSPTKITQPTSAPTTWTLIATGLTAPSGGSVFTKSGTGIVLDLRVTVTDREPVLIQSTTLSRQTSTESAPCL